MKKILIMAAVLLGLLSFSSPAFAAYNGNPLGNACATDGAQDASACSTTAADPVGGVNGILRKATKIISIIAGVAAVILVLIAGLQYVTSDGDSAKIKAAKNTLVGAIVGVVLVASAQAILTFVLRKV